MSDVQQQEDSAPVNEAPVKTVFGNQPPPCGQCKYGISRALNMPLECHRFPPKTFPVLNQSGQVVGAQAFYPGVRRDGPGCGEFTIKLSAAQ